ncbi:MAG TPA: flagellar hook capping FlgD N-terminal domain-containing protein [Burkholderiaceae bacterium]
MTTAIGTNPLAGTSGALPNAASSSNASAASALGPTTSAADQSANFLKMLVAQMQNQDPLNPMDSAQVTSQMAQISTVQGVQTLNTTLQGLNSQFTQMQTLQGAALVGKDVATEGDAVRVNPTTGKGDGGFELATAATSVKVEVVNAAGQTVDTIDMGAQDSGRHSFSFDVPAADQGQALTFKVTAASKAGAVDTMNLQYSTVSAVSTLNGTLALELNDGQRVAYDAIWAFL